MHGKVWLRLLVAALAASRAIAQEPLAVRLENFTVMPSTGPVVNAQVRNRADQAVNAVVRVRWPAGWKVAPAEQRVSVAPGAVARAAFTIEKALDLAANRYELIVEASVPGATVVRTQQVVCATAPYLKPQIDGNLDDWQDAVPLTFTADGQATTVMTCWNRQQFCVAARVNEARLTTSAQTGTSVGPDAVQFAVAAERSSPPEAGKSGRYEFVVSAASPALPAKCFRLLQPEDELRLAGQARPLAGLECGDVQAAVVREGTVTCYEIAVPVKLMPDLRPTPGRAFRFSLLVHDAGGTRLRDLGTLMNLWEDQRQPDSWCRWLGGAFGPTPPYDSNAEFGFSSSIH